MGQNQEKILATMRAQGPVLPAKIAKLLNTNILIASAHLSELVDNKKIRYSHTKVGGSPVYYLEGQETKLQELYTNLNDKEKNAFDELKAKKVLKDSSQTPLMRVALRNIKDFAVPINVNHDGQVELFWKWYLISNEEAGGIIKSTFEKQQNLQEKAGQQEKARQEEEKRKQEEQQRIQLENQRQEEERKKQEEQKRIEEEKKKQEQERKKQEEQKKIDLENQKLEQERLKKEKIRLEQERKKFELEKRKLEQERQKGLEQKKAAERQEVLKKENQKEAVKIEESDPFLQQVKDYLNKKNIQINQYEIEKKKKELNLTVTIPSAIGPIQYLCIAKKKRKVSDSDLNAAFVEGQLNKKPVLFLTTGTLSKKAAAKLAEEFKGILINKLD